MHLPVSLVSQVRQVLATAGPVALVAKYDNWGFTTDLAGLDLSGFRSILAVPEALAARLTPAQRRSFDLVAALPSLVDGFRAVQMREDAWLAHAADADLATPVVGPLVPGGTCTVAQAITQVCLHSLGHRAQCAKLLRRHAVALPTTDYILWVVERPAACWP